MADLLSGLGADVSGVGTNTLRVRVRRSRARSLIAGWSDDCAVRSCSAVHCSHGLVGYGWHPPVGTFRRDGPCRPFASARGHGCAAPGGDRPGLCAGGAGGAPSRVDLPRGSVGHWHGDGAPRCGVANGESEIRHAACEPHVVELCRFLTRMGPRSRVLAHRPSELSADGDWLAPSTGWTGTISRRAAGWSRRR